MVAPVTKLFLVTRADLPPGDQAVQAAHALREFVAHHPEIDLHWYRTSNTLAFLAARDEPALGALLVKARDQGLACAPFTEPDRNDELTAVAFGPDCRRLLSSLPRALRCMRAA